MWSEQCGRLETRFLSACRISISATARRLDSLNGLPQPDAIFIGCGTAGGKVIAACWEALKPGGRIVVNAVTIESEVALLAAYDGHGGTLTRLSVQRAEPVGKRTAWRPAMPVLQWVAAKPLGEL